MSNAYSFFTFASGKKYLALAFALARSHRFHNGLNIGFGIASNADFELPRDLKWVKKVIAPIAQIGPGLEFKLHLPELAPTPTAIFIDADSLIYDNVNFLFEAFDNAVPNVIGLKVTDGEWVDEDIALTCKEFDLDYMIRYCGALYYVINNDTGKQVFDYANALYRSGRAFQRNENTMYDEPILSVALSKFKIEPLPDDGNIWGDLVHFKYDDELNIFKSRPVFYNNKSKPNYKFWLPEGEYAPKILHVGSGNYNKKPWLFDALRLKLHYKFWLPVAMSDTLVKWLVIPVYKLARKLLR